MCGETGRAKGRLTASLEGAIEARPGPGAVFALGWVENEFVGVLHDAITSVP